MTIAVPVSNILDNSHRKSTAPDYCKMPFRVKTVFPMSMQLMIIMKMQNSMLEKWK